MFLLNLVLKFTIQGLINDMKIVSKTEERIYAMVSVTLTQFVNTAAILAVRGLLFDANLESHVN